MNDFSYVEKLLDGVEVVWFPISEVTERTTNIKWSETSESLQYIDLTSVSVDTKKIIKTTEVKASNAPSRAQKLVKKDDVLFATTRPTQMRYCLIDEEYNGAVASTGYCVLRVKRDMTLPKWILHLISSSDFKKYLEENQSGSAYPAISDAKVKDFSIPIPCPDNLEKSLAIQSEIVRILDKFTALTAELTAELNMRKKQYNYYRDKLLSFEEGEVEWKALAELGELVRGNGLPKADFTTSGVPAIHYGQIYTHYGLSTETTISYVSPETARKLKKVNTGDVVITNTSENLEDVGKALVYLGNSEAVTGGHATIFKPNKLIIGKYFAYFTQTSTFFSAKRKLAKGTKVIDVSATDMAKIQIPIPCPDNPEKSLAIQSEIVRILDKFDALTNSITEGLPREIELRQKQYEYYRDLLLNFPKPEAAA
ncbi:restriction endonuclease subunit S [Proteus terrae]|uniref:restriction endonuclease subunit S n=1 Tax=Proteus terrae TaxID=1574161 RepID=UPI003075C24E